MNCPYCKNPVKSKELFNEKGACPVCDKAPRKAFFDVSSLTYVVADDLLSKNKEPVVALDLHNVADLFTPDELGVISMGHRIVLISFVGRYSDIRIQAGTQLQEYLALSNVVGAYLCFHRSEKCKPGTKGAFLKAYGNVELFLDDTEQHITSARAAGIENPVWINMNDSPRNQIIALLSIDN